MAKDLIIERQEVGVPPTPVIVKDLYSLDGGVEIYATPVSEGYPGGVINYQGENFPKVLKAGHVVFQLTMGEKTAWLSAPTDDENEIISSRAGIDSAAINIGILKNDAEVHVDYNADTPAPPTYIGAIMLIGAVDCDYMPAKVGVRSIFEGEVIEGHAVENPEACNITFLNRKLE